MAQQQDDSGRSATCNAGSSSAPRDGTAEAPIITSFVYPPIPIRTSDWCAYRDPESGPYGWGRTEEAAIADLLSLEDDELGEKL